MKRLIILWLLLATPALAQTSGTAEMRKLDFLVGEWQGEGWITAAGGQRHTFKQTEHIQSKVGGHVLLIEGLGKSQAPGEAERVVHNAFAVVSYDGTAKRWRFLAWRATGDALDAEATVG